MGIEACRGRGMREERTALPPDVEQFSLQSPAAWQLRAPSACAPPHPRHPGGENSFCALCAPATQVSVSHYVTICMDRQAATCIYCPYWTRRCIDLQGLLVRQQTDFGKQRCRDTRRECHDQSLGASENVQGRSKLMFENSSVSSPRIASLS